MASITAEELGHVELISTAINLMLEGSVPEGEPTDAPLADAKNLRNTHHTIVGTVALTSGSPNHPLGLAIRRQPGTGGSQSGSHCGRLACM